MAITDIFKTKDFKQRINELEAENKHMQDMMTPEMNNAISLKKKIEELSGTVKNLENEIQNAEKELSSKNIELQKLKDKVIVQQEVIELEEFSLYEPRFRFSTSEQYKEKLDSIRNEQKSMIKNDVAAHGAQGWTVNNSISQGKKLVNNMKKLCLRSFNCECDAAVQSVRFNNFDRCETRIRKSAETIAKTAQMMSVYITQKYIDLKIDELHLALEYAIQKQKEKEELKELRAQQREAAKLAKELEEARKAVEKERKHYERALIETKNQLETCTEDERLDVERKISEIESTLAKIDKNIKDLDYREANQRAGYVYIISNIGAFGENIYKIGMTRRLEPMDRIDELSDASVPFNFDVHAMIFSDDAPALENALHHAFEDKKVNMINQRREFFNVTLGEIKEVVKNHHDKTIEFIELPPAEQYRETQKIKKLI